VAEEPPCLYVLSADTNDLGIRDCSSARKHLSNRSTSGPFAFAWKSHDRGATSSSLTWSTASFACDLVKLRLDDICSGAKVRHRATIVQKKTGRPVQYEITEQSRSSVEAWLPMLRTTGSRYLFPSRLHARPHISTRQYARLVHRWVQSIGLARLRGFAGFEDAGSL
jgi:hypothetical protein